MDEAAEPKPESLLRQKEYALAEYFHAQMVQGAGDDPEALQELQEVYPDEVVESMRHCQHCGEEIFSIEDQRRILLEYDDPKGAAREFYVNIARHVNKCPMRIAEGAPMVKLEEEPLARPLFPLSDTMVFALLYLTLFVLVLFVVGVVHWWQVGRDTMMPQVALGLFGVSFLVVAYRLWQNK